MAIYKQNFFQAARLVMFYSLRDCDVELLSSLFFVLLLFYDIHSDLTTNGLRDSEIQNPKYEIPRLDTRNCEALV